jgi:hypothetical protein
MEVKIYRQAHPQDENRLSVAADMFARRHRLEISHHSDLNYTDLTGANNLAFLWERAKCRALLMPLSISEKYQIWLQDDKIVLTPYWQ